MRKAIRRPSWTEVLLLVLLGVVLTVLFTRGGGNTAYAGGGAAGGIIALAGHAEKADLLYVVDTKRQRVCVYRWFNPGLRLVAARAFDYDLELLDTAGDRRIEGGKGATRNYVKTEVERFRRARELKPLK